MTVSRPSRAAGTRAPPAHHGRRSPTRSRHLANDSLSPSRSVHSPLPSSSYHTGT
jgi:hypothetical protein